MNFLKTFFVLSLLIFIASSCASKKEQVSEASIEPDQKQLKIFERASRYLDEGKNKEAARLFEEISQNHMGSEFDFLSIFNAGIAYEAMGQCARAGRKFRKIFLTGKGRFPKMEARALVRLSYAYECLGRHKLVVSSLVDALKRKSQLSRETVEAEIPARLGAAYARMGEVQSAEEYFKKASQGIQKINLRKKSHVNRKADIAQLLFLMGNSHQKATAKGQQILDYSRSLNFLNAYLLQAAEMDSKPWSTKASVAILAAYDHLLENLNRVTIESEGDADSQVRNRKIMELKQKVVNEGLMSLRGLKASRVPGLKTPLLIRLDRALEQREKKLQYAFIKFSEGAPLSRAAEKRQGLKRKGRLVPPPSSSLKNKKKRP